MPPAASAQLVTAAPARRQVRRTTRVPPTDLGIRRQRSTSIEPSSLYRERASTRQRLVHAAWLAYTSTVATSERAPGERSEPAAAEPVRAQPATGPVARRSRAGG